MKPKHLKRKKLSLNKATVVNLNNGSMHKVYGGDPTGGVICTRLGVKTCETCDGMFTCGLSCPTDCIC
ncbi:MAG: hypothetical protein GTO45_23960 [Candidatus Aminicenantes bacterium]|nr:hypothetical protein [Candidatus Aminicenantes bacterium]NIM81812.1 hypothetical protein [Candidatus Aminicenantes bacterium]NIN21184.1 hypothetical protein [Candidatus Aminicenantes bacterium]NIN45008.1 hypothetical protein [Candidatus Aminicenantes bacterium]NIN87822.1 hypothetical protein [Candidatus Aminicenantes bacterium]